MHRLYRLIQRSWLAAERLLDLALPLADLAARLYVARVFFLSGMNKINDWSSTIYLFQAEYRVPLLSPEVAAVFGTAGELILPLMLALGLFTRFAASGLFILNLVALVSYYHVLQTSPAAIKDHLEWGIILLLLATAPVRQLTLDRLMRCCKPAG